MKLALALFGAAAFYGGAQLFGTGAPAATPGPLAAGGAYRLVANGGVACTVMRGPAAGRGGAFELRPAAACERLMPGLARARVWREEADGTIEFSADGTHPLVAFAAADGDGYESFRPAAPLLSLTAAIPEPVPD